MSFARALLLNRIGGQMAVLVLASIFAIQAIVIAGLFLSHRFEAPRIADEGPGEIVALVRLVADTPRGAERSAMLAHIAKVFPQVTLTPAAAMPADIADTPAEPHLRFLKDRLGHDFPMAALPGAATHQIVIGLPDGDVLTVRMPPPTPPPTLGNPIIITVLFVIVSTTLLLLWATRALRTPLSGFAKAAESFSLDGDMAALPERGPEEIRAVARAFNRMRERIRKLVDDRTRLFAAMGHDLRTPTTRLRLRSEFIADPELRAQMLRDLDQMKAMTEDVLSFLRDGQAREGATPIDIASVLQTVCDQFADMGYNVTYHGPDHATIAARPHDLQRAVTNLVDNAARHASTTLVRLSVGPAGVTVEVEDDGPGIADERKEAMLEAFVRGDEARTMDERSGFGLGLSIARATADAHGGTLTLHDRAPHGLIARITLPSTIPSAAPAAH